jgi:hypothetical protein
MLLSTDRQQRVAKGNGLSRPPLKERSPTVTSHSRQGTARFSGGMTCPHEKVSILPGATCGSSWHR